MSKCKNKNNRVNQAPTIKPVWYKRLKPTRKTVNKWVKWLMQSIKLEINFGEMFKWIFFSIVWMTFFPNSATQLERVAKLVSAFL